VLIGTLWEKAKDSWVEDGGRQPAQAWHQMTCFNTFVPPYSPSSKGLARSDDDGASGGSGETLSFVVPSHDVPPPPTIVFYFFGMGFQ